MWSSRSPPNDSDPCDRGIRLSLGLWRRRMVEKVHRDVQVIRSASRFCEHPGRDIGLMDALVQNGLGMWERGGIEVVPCVGVGEGVRLRVLLADDIESRARLEKDVRCERLVKEISRLDTGLRRDRDFGSGQERRRRHPGQPDHDFMAVEDRNRVRWYVQMLHSSQRDDLQTRRGGDLHAKQTVEETLRRSERLDKWKERPCTGDGYLVGRG